MLPFKKIYVDSRWCTADSVNSSNFKVELPQTMMCPENTIYFRYMYTLYVAVNRTRL